VSGRTPLFAAHGKSSLLRYISCSLICVLRDLSYRAVLLVPLPRARGLCPSRSYCASFYSTTIFAKGSSRDSRNPPLPPQGEKQTKLGKIVFAIGPRSSFSLSSSPRPSCLVAPASMRRIRFPRGWKKSPVAVDDRHQTRKFLYKYMSFGLTLYLWETLRLYKRSEKICPLCVRYQKYTDSNV